MRFITLILALITPSLAHADFFLYPQKTFTVSIICGGSVDCGQAVSTFKKADAYVQRVVNVKLKIKRIVKIHEDMSGGFDERQEKWRLRTAEYSKDSDLTYVFLDSFPSLVNYIDFQTENILGVTSGIGILGKEHGMIISKLVGAPELSFKICVHELGHALGATHANSGLMYPSANVNQYSEDYSLESIEQIKEHLMGLP